MWAFFIQNISNQHELFLLLACWLDKPPNTFTHSDTATVPLQVRLLNDKECCLEQTSVQQGQDQCQLISSLWIRCSWEKCLTQTCIWEFILDHTVLCKYVFFILIQVCIIVTLVLLCIKTLQCSCHKFLLVRPCHKTGRWAQVSCTVLFQVSLYSFKLGSQFKVTCNCLGKQWLSSNYDNSALCLWV